MTTEPEADIDDDFAPVSPGRAAIAMLVRGTGRREVADDLQVSLAELNRIVAQEVRERSGEAGTQRERLALVHAGLDEILRIAYAQIDDETEETAPLLEVALGVQRLRAGLLAMPSRATHTDSTTERN